MRSESPLEGRWIVVTGGGRRLGRAIAEGLLARGGNLVLLVRDSVEGARDVAERARALGRECRVHVADLASRSSTDETLAAIAREADGSGGLDALVHAAASYERLPFPETSDAVWDRVLELNLTIPFRLARRLAPLLSRSTAPGGGSIVLLADLASFLPFRRAFAHSVTKGSLVPLVRNLALALAPAVRVNAVAPGPALPSPDLTDEERRVAFERIPMGHAGGPEEVVRGVVYLLASESVTGEILRLDGGRGLR